MTNEDGLDLPGFLRRDPLTNRGAIHQPKESHSRAVSNADSRPAAGLNHSRPQVIYTFTNLNTYENICPHQFYRRYVKKDLPYIETPAMKNGNDLHTAMEQRIAGKPLPEAWRHWEPLVKPFVDRQAQAEMKLAVTYAYQPVDFWEKSVLAGPFIRGKLDCVLIDKQRAYLNDWKTSRKPRDEPFELEVGAMLLKAKYPQLETIIGTYTWGEINQVGKPHDLSDTMKTFRKCADIAKRIEQDQTFEKRPGPLCGWCDVIECEHNRKPKFE